MKKQLCLVVLSLLVLAAAAGAQKLPKPTQMPGPNTDPQRRTIQEGIALHDAKKYDEAIAKYQGVLKENPDSTLALYELSLSYATKGDRAKAKETAFVGAKYISDELGLFYTQIANALDDEGKPDEAIKVYREAEEILKKYSDLRRHLSSTYYNLGLTYFRQKKYNEAKAELKNAIRNNFAYASPHSLLAVIYRGTRYRVPALLAAMRLVSLEYSTQRTAGAVEIITETLKPAQKDAKGNMTINLDFSAPKDEGDFGMYDLFLGTLTSVRGEEDKNKTDNQMFVEGISSVIALLAEDDKLRNSFVGATYVPFVADMKKNGHVEAFGNVVLYLKDNKNDEAAKWIKDNGPKIESMFTWAKAYQPPKK